jgi:hypothetical protein
VVGIKGGPGLDANGLPNAAFTSTFQINVLTAAGNAVQAVGESGEFDPVFGYIGKTNRMARLGAGGGTTSGLNLLDVTKAPYLADTTGTVDCSAFVAQAALDVATGGYDGISFPSGIYKMSSTPVVIPKVPRFVITGVPGGTIIHTATESSVFDATTDGPANVVVVGLTVLGPDTIVLNSHAISMASIYSESLSLTDCYLSKLDSALFTEVADVYLLRVTTLGNNIGLLMNTTTTCQSGGDINECVFSDVTASIVLGTLQGG